MGIDVLRSIDLVIGFSVVMLLASTHVSQVVYSYNTRRRIGRRPSSQQSKGERHGYFSRF
jgi:hypothetical protein